MKSKAVTPTDVDPAAQPVREPALDLVNSASEKKEAAPETTVLVIGMATKNRHLVWAYVHGAKKEGPVRLRVRDSKFYRAGEQIRAIEVERDLWEDANPRRAPRYRNH